MAGSEDGSGKRVKAVRKSFNIDLLDFFARPYPLFNVKGNDKVSSTCGLMMTVVLVVILMAYGSYKI